VVLSSDDVVKGGVAFRDVFLRRLHATEIFAEIRSSWFEVNNNDSVQRRLSSS